MEQNTLSYSQNVEIIKDLFVNRLREDGDQLTYDDIRRMTGIEIRHRLNPNGYQASLKAREMCESLPVPFSVEVIRGKGVQRVRIGKSGHAKPNSWLGQIRRKSTRSITLTSKALPHAQDDAEALAIRTQSLIHSDVLSRTHSDAYRAKYTHLSNGEVPQRPPVSLRDLLRKVT